MQNRQRLRLYENLIDEEKGVYNEEDGSMNINPNSLEVQKELFCRAELWRCKSI